MNDANDETGECSNISIYKDKENVSSPIHHQNQPFLMTRYKELNNLTERLVIIVPLFSGITNVRFSLNEDGTECILKYNWPKMFFNFTPIANNDQNNTAMVLSLQEQLKQHRSSVNEMPEGTLIIKLPFAVQTEINDNTVVGIEDADGTKILRINLIGFIKQYAQKVTTVTFIK